MGHVLVRKVELAVWEGAADGLADGEVAADFLSTTRELRTTNNTLSFWRFDDSEPSWRDQAALAIVGGWRTMADGLHLVHLPEEAIHPLGIEFVHSDGVTCVESLKKFHVDAARLDLVRLAALGTAIATHIRAHSSYYFKTRKEVFDLLSTAANDRLIKVDQLPNDLKLAVKKHMAP